MAEFLIESNHGTLDCLRALYEMMEQKSGMLESFRYGCRSGDHRGWAILPAADAEAARMLLPSYVRDTATVTEVYEFTPQQVAMMHKEAGH
ncbi:MAG: hypothetical protein DWI59_05610 [Chloroflexi bacterium]|nr:MAG: hypothetical protein DWI59_05610 [Chloroflexota bacterium]